MYNCSTALTRLHDSIGLDFTPNGIKRRISSNVNSDSELKKDRILKKGRNKNARNR